MLRRLALTLVPGVALYTVAACLTVVQARRADATRHQSQSTVAADEQLAARSGYIVASS